ncbi:heat-inducible transcriptional repressor HrcA [Candidatus Latescibacterota bacterium]
MIDRRARRDRIIETIVSEFIETAQPVSSTYVARSCGLGVSPATVRNVMKDLEDEGYLTQPHTSAGRLPTIKCYRYYVSHIMPDIDKTDDEIREAKRLVENVLREHDAEVFMNHIAGVLSEVTDLIGIIMSPSFDRGVFDRLEIVSMGGSTFLVILSLKAGIVKTINVTINRVIPRIRIEETARLITGRLHGLSVAEIKETIGTRLKGITGGDRSLFDVILDRKHDIFTFDNEKLLHVSGLSRLLSLPEFEQGDSTVKLVDLVERKSEIAGMLDSLTGLGSDVNIRIGSNDFWDSPPPLSLVSASFHHEDAHGAVAVIGPTRIHYPKMRAIVRYTAQVASHFFTQDK